VEDPREAAELLTAAALEDPSAWNALVARFGPQLWHIARACGLNKADAEDVVQGTWLRLVENLYAIREPAGIASWLRTTARREALLIARKGGAEFASGTASALDGATAATFDTAARQGAADPVSALLEADGGRLLWQAISLLHEPCRTLLRLVATDTGGRQLAVRLGVPAGSVGPTRARCLDKLRTLISLEELVP